MRTARPFTAAAIRRAMDEIAGGDGDVARARARIGDPPPPRPRPPGFAGLLSIIIGQQISAAAARTIGTRVFALMPEQEPTPQALLALDDEALRQAGMSAAKRRAARALAAELADGTLDIAALEAADDAEVAQRIIALRGFGPWSAQMYLMFYLGRPDVFAPADLALQTALQRIKGLDARPQPRQAEQMVAHWQPHRTVGSLFLWHCIHRAPALEAQP